MVQSVLAIVLSVLFFCIVRRAAQKRSDPNSSAITPHLQDSNYMQIERRRSSQIEARYPAHMERRKTLKRSAL